MRIKKTYLEQITKIKMVDSLPDPFEDRVMKDVLPPPHLPLPHA